MLTLYLPFGRYSGYSARATSPLTLCKLLGTATLVLLLLLSEATQASEPAPLDLAGQSEIKNLTAQASYVFFHADYDDTGIAPNLSLEEARALAATSNEYTQSEVLKTLAPKDPNVMDANYLLGPIWARLILSNSGDSVERWRIDARDAYGPTLRAFSVGEGEPRLILDNRWVTQAMDERVPQTRMVASQIIEIPAGDHIEVWIDAEYGIPFDNYFRLVSEERFDADRQSDLAIASLMLGVRLALLLALLAFALVLRDTTAAYYAGFHFGLVLATLSQWGFDSFYLGLGEVATGIAFRLTWAWTVIFYALTVASFLDVRTRYTKYARWLFLSTLTGLATLPVLSVFDLNIHWQWARPIVEAVMYLQFAVVVAIGILKGLHDKLPGARWFLFASAMLLLLAVMRGFDAFQALAFANWEVDHFTNGLFALDGLLFAAALVIRAIEMRSQRDHAREAQMRALADQASLQERLNEAEIDYQLALEIAEKRRRDLEATSHDLKQPLLSLQMALSKMEGGQEAEQGVSYIAQVLERSRSQASNAAPSETTASDAEGEGFEVWRALQNVATMFDDEAAAKGLILKPVHTSVRVQGEPVVLMRILANLVSNAVHHSHGTRVTIGAKRNDAGVDLIVADNGRGIPSEDVKAVFERYNKASASQGDGVGLATVRQLANEQGWSVGVTNLSSGGAVFRLIGLHVA